MISNLIALLPIPLGLWFGIFGGGWGLFLGLLLIGLGLSNFNDITGEESE